MNSDNQINKIFVLYHPSTFNSTITIGTKGIKIIYCDDDGCSLDPVYILFNEIRVISEITMHSQKDYKSFTLNCSKNNFEIKMRHDIDTVYDLIITLIKCASYLS